MKYSLEHRERKKGSVEESAKKTDKRKPVQQRELKPQSIWRNPL